MLDLKRIIIIIGIIFLIVAVSFGVYYWVSKGEEKEVITEYTPQEEISEEQMRQTMVSLYYKKGEEVMPEARLIDVKKLIENPYIEIINLLLEGPKNEKLEKIIPEGTKVNRVERQGDKLIIDFSKEFNKINEMKENDKKLVIQSIEKTVTQLTEINEVEILVDNMKFN